MGLLILFACGLLGPPAAPKNTDLSCRLALLDRQISQYGSRWFIRYRVEYEGDTTLDLTASDLTVVYDALVSNSRCKPHRLARPSHAHFALAEASSILSTVIANENERHRCRERISLAISPGTQPLNDLLSSKNEFVPMRLIPGQIFWLYLTLEHDHFLYGPYDPLLGVRQLEIQLGPCRLIDSIPLDVEQAQQRPLSKLSVPPHERLDARQFRSAPDSLHLTMHEPGYQYFRFDDIPVRYNSEFTLTFWYLIAQGTEGGCHVRVTEYQDAPGAWYRLDGGIDEPMDVQGRWVQFQRTFRTREAATTMVIDFRIVDASVGDMWIDDVQLTPSYVDNAETLEYGDSSPLSIAESRKQNRERGGESLSSR